MSFVLPSGACWAAVELEAKVLAAKQKLAVAARSTTTAVDTSAAVQHAPLLSSRVAVGGPSIAIVSIELRRDGRAPDHHKESCHGWQLGEE